MSTKHFGPCLRPDDSVDADFCFLLERFNRRFGLGSEDPIDCDTNSPLNALHPDAPAPPAQESSRVGGEEVFPGLRADDPVDADPHRFLKCLDAGFSFGSEDSIDRQSAQGFLNLLDLRSPVTSADQVRGLRRRLWSRFGGFRFYRFLAEEFQNPFGMQSPHLFDP